MPTFRNWARTVECHPRHMVSISSEQDLIHWIKESNRLNLPLRVVGAGHSPSDIACTNGILITMENYNQLLHIHPTTSEVTVQAGMRLHTLHQHLRKHQLALSVLGSISDQSVSGAVSTGTHGTGYRFGSLCSYVTRLRLVLADGRIRTCSGTSTDQDELDLFRAAVCSLGSLAVISEITLRVEPAYRLHAQRQVISFQDMLQQWSSLVTAAEHVRMWWWPHTDAVLVWSANRTKAPADRQPASWVQDRFVNYHLLELLYAGATFVPSLVPHINQWYAPVVGQTLPDEVDDSVAMFNFDCLFKQYVNEWAIDWKQGPVALRDLRTMIQDKQLKVHFPVEIRFVQGEEGWLSPTYGLDCACYIGIIMYRPYGWDVEYQAYWKEYEAIMRLYKGRPHWAKAHTMTPRELANAYPQFEAFCRLRNQLDPKGRFLNDYLRRHLIINNAKL